MHVQLQFGRIRMFLDGADFFIVPRVRARESTCGELLSHYCYMASVGLLDSKITSELLFIQQ